MPYHPSKDLSVNKDQLGGISSNIRSFSSNVFDATDRQIDYFASSVRNVFTASSWFPESIKPPPPPSLPANRTYISQAADWISRHKAVSAAVVAFVSTGGVLVWHQKRENRRRRRARRTISGARKEVVVVAGEVGSLLLRSLIADLEKRGFVVYVIVKSIDEEDAIREEAQGKGDVRPFLVDVNEVRSQRRLLCMYYVLIKMRIANANPTSPLSIPKPPRLSTPCLSRRETSRVILHRSYSSTGSHISVWSHRNTLSRALA
jgi:hypothetical protein